MKNCHDEQLFIWSSKSKQTDERIESTGEEFPEGYGIDFRQEYYMMMIIYEYVDTELIDNSGSKIFKIFLQYYMILIIICQIFRTRFLNIMPSFRFRIVIQGNK